MNEQTIFDIAIYRIAEDAFIRQYNKDLALHMDDMRRRGMVTVGQLPDWEIRVEHHFWSRYGMPWRYNQVVGWVRVYILDTQVRGDLWVAEGARFSRRMPNKSFRLSGKAFEVWTLDGDTDEEIRKDVLRELLTVTKGLGHLDRCKIDLDPFMAISSFIRWRAMLGYEQA